MRGVDCDVWATEVSNSDTYTTIEVFFSHRNWSVQVEVLNHEQQVPMGITTYTTKEVRHTLMIMAKTRSQKLIKNIRILLG